MEQTQLLVIGAGPYALSAAALARERGIQTTVLGRPRGFWRQNMPTGMFLRSGPDWHFDAAGVHTLEAQAKDIDVREEFVETLARENGQFEATLAGGERIRAGAVVAAPGISHYTHVPAWASALPAGHAAHTCDLVRFDDMAGARVLSHAGLRAVLRIHQGSTRRRDPDRPRCDLAELTPARVQRRAVAGRGRAFLC
jgi:FAD-dependent urate hydroxylase